MQALEAQSNTGFIFTSTKIGEIIFFCEDVPVDKYIFICRRVKKSAGQPDQWGGDL